MMRRKYFIENMNKKSGSLVFQLENYHTRLLWLCLPDCVVGVPSFFQGKGEMKTYWLAGRRGDQRTVQFCDLLRAERTMQQRAG